MLYVHKDRQSQGIGKIILMELERLASESGSRSIALFSSITARSFFESAGYVADRKNTVVRNGIPLTNYHMSKQIS